MRIVLDSNVLLRVAISPAGPAAAAFRLIQPPHILVASSYLLADLADCLNYPRVRPLHKLDDSGIASFVQWMYLASENVAVPISAVASVSRDPDDDLIVATAVEGHADVLCTRDKDIHDPPVVRYCQLHGIEVLSDVQLLDRLRAMTTP